MYDNFMSKEVPEAVENRDRFPLWEVTVEWDDSPRLQSLFNRNPERSSQTVIRREQTLQ
jgi:hypothetical protein